MKEQKISISQFSLFACPGYTCHKLSEIKKNGPFDAFTFIEAVVKFSQLYNDERRDGEVIEQIYKSPREMREFHWKWQSGMPFCYGLPILRNLGDPVLIALGLHAYVTGSNPFLTPGCEFYLLLSEIQLHHAL